ncbi:MAG TPA: ATP-dependent helicase, partial [Vulgatibacter sp.]
ALSVLGDDAGVDGDLIDVRHVPQALLDAAGGELAAGLYSVGSAVEAKEAGARKLGPGSPLVKAAAKLVQSAPAEGVSFLALDAGRASPVLAPHFGKEGFWFVYKFEAGNVDPDERIVHLVLVREGGVYRALDLEEGALFVEIPARTTMRQPAGATTSVGTWQESALARAQAAVKLEVEARRGVAADKARERWDRFTEECLDKPRKRIADAKAAWEAARKALLGAPDDRERARLRRARDSAEREYRRGLDQLRLEEQRRFGDKERAIADVARKAAVGEVRRTLLATAYWFLE